MEEFDIVDPEFGRFLIGNSKMKKLSSGHDWTEGPVWFGDAECLLFSDIPNNRVHRWTPRDGVSVFREPSNYANGHTRDLTGRLISCEHGTRRVTRTEWDGSITVVADRFDGKRLNSPNDVVVKSDGSIWFTDPHYGIATDYEGFKAPEELPCRAYRVDPSLERIEVVADGFGCPNGIAFSPDESKLYVSDTGRMHDPDADTHIREYEVKSDGSLSGGTVFHRVAPGVADGFRLDTDGNVWTSAGDGVHCISPSGKLLGKILVPETVSNVCFGGRAKHHLFITATTSVYAIVLNRAGAQRP